MSTQAKRNWPSLGFFAILVSYSLLVTLLAWGSQEPALDKVFEILTQRELDSPLRVSKSDARLLQKAWSAHPGLGRAILGKNVAKFIEPTESGWLSRTEAHLATRCEANQSAQFAIEARGAPGDFPIHVKISGNGFERQLDLATNQPQTIAWSANDFPQPAVLDVEVTPKHSRSAAAPTWAIRIVPNSARPDRDAP